MVRPALLPGLLARAEGSAVSEPTILAWRHPRAENAEGRCIGRTDLPTDPRRAKRLAHRIRTVARRDRLPQIVITSPLRRSAQVGAWLARWGWVHRVDPALSELDFGRWDGAHWGAVPQDEIDAWCADFESCAPGGGESVYALLQRVGSFDPGAARVLVTHGGWLSAAAWLQQGHGKAVRPESWPIAPAHAACVELRLAQWRA